MNGAEHGHKYKTQQKHLLKFYTKRNERTNHTFIYSGRTWLDVLHGLLFRKTKMIKKIYKGLKDVGITSLGYTIAAIAALFTFDNAVFAALISGGFLGAFVQLNIRAIFDNIKTKLDA